MTTEKRRDITSYCLLKVNPHKERRDCGKPFICLAKIRDSSIVGDGYLEKYRVSIEISLIVASYSQYSTVQGVIKNPSFDVTLTRLGEGEYSMSTLHFYVDTEWARDRGLGKYMLVKILNLLKGKIDHSHVGELSFNLSESQGKESKERLLRNYFYKSIGCTLKGHDDDDESWESVEGAQAVLDFNKLPQLWNTNKVSESALAQSLQEIFINQQEMLREIEAKNKLVEHHKKSTLFISKWRNRINSVWISGLQLGFIAFLFWTIIKQFE